MTKCPPTAAEISAVETELWNVIRSIEAIERIAFDVAAATSGDVNAQAEGIAGIAALAVGHIRRQQIALGGSE